MRSLKFQTGEYYHIYNRGVDRRDVFMDDKDFVRFLRSMREFNSTEVKSGFYVRYIKEKNKGGSTSNLEVEPHKDERLVDIICYCLNYNHFHFVLRQLSDSGITKFMQRLGTAYTMYFNQKYNRSGSLLQGRFKAIHVKKYGHLLKLLVYVNCNYEVHGLEKSENWIWSSYLDSIGARNGMLCNFDIIYEEFRSLENFEKFCNDVLRDVKVSKELRKYLLE